MNTLKLLNSLKIALKETSAKKTSLKINYLNSIYKKAISKDALSGLKYWFNGDYSKLSFDKLFNGKIRIVLPFESGENETLYELVTILKSMGWAPSKDGVSFSVNKIKQKLRREETGEEYEVDVDSADLRVSKQEEYRVPYGPNAGQIAKKTLTSTISKILFNPKNNIKQDIIKFWEKNQTLYTRDNNWSQIEACFKLDKSELTSGRSIIISRDPIDVLRMSDHENISSCHSETGSYFQCAVSESRGNGIVAYVVKNSDLNNFLLELGVKNLNQLDNIEIFKDPERDIDGIVPISRVKLRKYVNLSEDYEFAAPESITFGENPPGFIDFVRDWAWSKQSYIFNKDGEVTLPDRKKLFMYGGSYRGSPDSDVVNLFFSKGTEKKLKYSGNFDTYTGNPEDRDMDTEIRNINKQLDEISERFGLKNTNITYNSEAFFDDDAIYYGLSIMANFYINLNGTSLDDSLSEPPQESIPDSDEPGSGHIIRILNVFDFSMHGDEEVSYDIVELDGKKFLKVMVSVDFTNVTDLDEAEESFGSITSEINRNIDEYKASIRANLIEYGYMIKSGFDSIMDEFYSKDYNYNNFDIIDESNDSGKITLVMKQNLTEIDIDIPGSILLAEKIDTANNVNISNLMLEIFDGKKESKKSGIIIIDNISMEIINFINKIEEDSKRQFKFEFFEKNKIYNYEDIKESLTISLGYKYDDIKIIDSYDFEGACSLSYLSFTIKFDAEYSNEQIELIKFFAQNIDNNFNEIYNIILESINDKIIDKENESKQFIKKYLSFDYARPMINALKSSNKKDSIRLAKWVEANWTNFDPYEKIFANGYISNYASPDGRLIRNYNHEDHYHRGLDLPNDWMHEHRASNISMKDIVV